MFSTTYSSYTELKRQNRELFNLLFSLGRYEGYRVDDMKDGHWFLKANPYFVTPKQWERICTRMLSYDNLKAKTLEEVIESFYYEQRTLIVEDQRFQIPSGNIMGWMQGMFMCIDAEGNINT